jgi:3-methyladenine DNA glycosylase AlkD
VAVGEPAAVADEMERRLLDAGTAERAEGERRYLKSSLEHLGATVRQTRREARRVAQDISSHDELVALVEELWAKQVHERRACAAFLLETRADLLGAADLPLIEQLLRESRTWALVDVLAGDAVGALLVHHPDAAAEVDSWASDDDFWLRRAALLSQLEPLRAGADFERGPAAEPAGC